jgi:alanine-glyoxylate transaminase/(R)-3-amino-2-methylpropionate-pyruvate transaminase
MLYDVNRYGRNRASNIAGRHPSTRRHTMPTGNKPAQTAIPIPATDHTPVPYTGPAKDEILSLRNEYLNPGILTYYKHPVCIVEGHMQYLWDEKGKRYLDGIAGIVSVSVGHCHPKITERVREQVGKLVHTTTIYLHPTIAVYARELARRMPDGSDLKVS